MADGEFDTFVDDVLGKDTTKRLAVAEALVTYLQDQGNPIPNDSALMDRLVDGLASWLNTSNFKLSEFDTPRALLTDESSRFSAMVKAADIDVKKYISVETNDVTHDEDEHDSGQASETEEECTQL